MNICVEVILLYFIRIFLLSCQFSAYAIDGSSVTSFVKIFG